MKKSKINEEEYQGFKIGDICTHPTFGKCKVTMFDKPRGLIQVKWPENSSSQAHWSLVEPETLKKSENMKTEAQKLIKSIKSLKTNEDQGSKKISNMLGWTNDIEDAKLSDQAMELVSGQLHMYDISDLKADDVMQIFKMAKKSQSEMYIDGEMVWVADDTQAVAAKLQDFARKNKLEVPRF